MMLKTIQNLKTSIVEMYRSLSMNFMRSFSIGRWLSTTTPNHHRPHSQPLLTTCRTVTRTATGVRTHPRSNTTQLPGTTTTIAVHTLASVKPAVNKDIALSYVLCFILCNSNSNKHNLHSRLRHSVPEEHKMVLEVRTMYQLCHQILRLGS